MSDQVRPLGIGAPYIIPAGQAHAAARAVCGHAAVLNAETAAELLAALGLDLDTIRGHRREAAA